MEQAVVKILLLGICGYGSNYIKEISERDIPGIKIEGICEVVPNAADLYPIIKEQNIPIYQTPEDFYKEHTTDLAVVSTPIHLHYSQIVTCLTHGSNVLTEKPVCTSVEGARKLEQLEKETGKFISVGYQLNYSRDVLALKQDILDDRFPCLRGLESPNKTEFSSGFLYRADALKELGFDQVPETIDEWEEVLRAAKAAGYSKPFTTRKEWVKDVWSAAYDNWGSFYVDDGVVKNGLIEDSRKDFIQKMADWYAEGLLDNDWMQADKKSTQTDFVSGNCILGYAPFGQGLGNYTKAMMEADPNFKEDYIQAAAPVTSTKGKNAKFSKMNNIYDQSGASAAISSQCKNVKAAVWLLDWLYSEEGQICYNFGIEGESYEMKDGKPVYTDLIMNNPDGMSVAQALAAYTRASTSGAGIQSEDYIDQYYAQDNQKKALELSMKTDMGEHMFPPTSVSEENQDRYSEIMSQVKTLADEMEASFICGTTPMSEWDSYQQKLKDAGIEEAVQMMQEAYDTYMAN